MENKRDIIDESLVYSINIFNANALQSINSSKKNSFIGQNIVWHGIKYLI